MFLPLLISVILVAYLTRKVTIRSKGLSIILVSYFTVLIVTTIVYYLIPEEAFNKEVSLTMEELDSVQSVSYNFYEVISEGRIDEAEGISEKERWLFDYDGEILQIRETDEYGLPWIIAERKDVDDGVIEVTHFSTKRIIDRLDFTYKIGSYDITLDGNSLIVMPPDRYEFQMATFKTDMVIAQFFGNGTEDIDDFTNGYIDIFGDEVLYLRIPKSLKFDENTYVEIIGEVPTF